MALDEEMSAYQTYLEAVRAHPEDEELWEDLQRAKDALEVAYLENLAGEVLTAGSRAPSLPRPDVSSHGDTSGLSWCDDVWTTSHPDGW